MQCPQRGRKTSTGDMTSREAEAAAAAHGIEARLLEVVLSGGPGPSYDGLEVYGSAGSG